MRILVTGVGGQLGCDLLRALSGLGEIVPADRTRLDLSDSDSVRAAVRSAAPGLIVNPAAYTAVDQAESQPDLAEQVNARGVAVLAEEARRARAWLIHYSTDYVFGADAQRRSGPARAGETMPNGAALRARREDDPPGPVSVYGRTKLAGEQAVRASGCRHLILRTSWVYSLRGRNFLTTMHRLARERDELRVVDDQFGAPTTSVALAQASALIAARIVDPGQAESLSQGVYHASCAGSTTWFGFACAIVERLDEVATALGAPPPARRAKVLPIPGSEYPTPAARPANSLLDNAKLREAFGVRLPHWRDAFDALLARPVSPATSPLR
ncbi:MAG: dTDP-4-dehydrorhamnose reductase [Burkholderiaceae bacterium]|nr:dTDP-4-dehydrorhamnose reductase [Burkholderiaceae bacterium]